MLSFFAVAFGISFIIVLLSVLCGALAHYARAPREMDDV